MVQSEYLVVELGVDGLRLLKQSEYLSADTRASLGSGGGPSIKGRRSLFEELRLVAAEEWTDDETIATEVFGRLSRALGEHEPVTPQRILAETMIADALKLCSPVNAGMVHEIEVRLVGLLPAIRRRLRVASEATLDLVHVVLQLAMGWTHSHIHYFETESHRVPMGGAEGETATTVLAGIAPSPKNTFEYVYDMGDSWLHEIQVVSVEEARHEDGLARCIDGARACPPDDCGGAKGYEALLRSLGDSVGKKRVRSLAGEDFDPDHFDLKLHARLLRRLSPC